MTKAPAKGWYDDPDQPGGLRYWDGNAWTEERRPAAGRPMPPPPPGPAPAVGASTVQGIASIEVRRAILQGLRDGDAGGKFRKPFDKGQLAALNILGGDWNDYAQIVLNMMIADTLLNIEERLARLDGVGTK